MREKVDVSLGFNTPVSTIIYLLGRDPQKLARSAAGRGGSISHRAHLAPAPRRAAAASDRVMADVCHGAPVRLVE